MVAVLLVGVTAVAVSSVSTTASPQLYYIYSLVAIVVGGKSYYIFLLFFFTN